MATQKELAEFLGLTDRTIRNLEKKGVLAKRGRQYDLGECTRSYITYIKSQDAKHSDLESEDGEGNNNSLAREEYRYTKLRNDKLQLQIDELSKRLAPVELLEFALSNIASQIIGVLDTIPGRLKKASPNLTETDLAVVRREIDKASNACADTKINFDDYHGVTEGDEEGA